MIRGVKPLAVFSWVEGSEIDFVMRYLRMFDRRVGAGQIVKHQHVAPVPQLPHLSYFHIAYTLPGEEWRAQAKLDLFNLPGPWTAARERRYGELLGYEDWQNDVWLQGFKE
jgi:hypothetical protein